MGNYSASAIWSIGNLGSGLEDVFVVAKQSKVMEKALKKDLQGGELTSILKRAGLPLDYATLTPKSRRKARMFSLKSWFDPEVPHVLCNDTEKFIKAMFLWTHFYIKPAEMNKGVYYFDDPTNKWDMVRMIMQPPLRKEEPAKSIVTATRRMGKTQTILVEMLPLLSIVRPFTMCLLSELNDTRTKEELGKIKQQIEENEIIHADFGGQGVLFPKRTSGNWSAHHLKFIHQPGCLILGHSLKSAQRGRGPIFGVIDDPEDEDNCFNMDWRKSFFAKLLNVYVPMFHYGCKLVWIGTPVHAGSCLSLAMKGMSESDESHEDVISDERFIDFRKGRFSIILQDPETGEYSATQPQRLSVEGFMEKLRINPISARKEVLCEPVTPGVRAFCYNQYRHGYMHCIRNGREYMLDLFTREEKPWPEFLEELQVFGAGDLADGQSIEADPGALAFIGVNPKGIIYVLDCWMARVFSEKLVERAYLLSEAWNCQAFGWEKAALQTVIIRQARRFVDQLRADGKIPPTFHEIENARKNKVRRILTLIPLFGRNEIRFLSMEKAVRDEDGIVHTSVGFPHEVPYTEMVNQFREFTDEGLSGHDDGPDSVEMAIRLAGNTRGELIQKEDLTSNEAIVTKWQKLGVEVNRDQIPMDSWTEKMHQESVRALNQPLGVIPYL